MTAPRKYGDELRERATRMVAGTTTSDAERIAQLERENRELRRAPID